MRTAAGAAPFLPYLAGSLALHVALAPLASSPGDPTARLALSPHAASVRFVLGAPPSTPPVDVALEPATALPTQPPPPEPAPPPAPEPAAPEPAAPEFVPLPEQRPDAREQAVPPSSEELAAPLPPHEPRPAPLPGPAAPAPDPSPPPAPAEPQERELEPAPPAEELHGHEPEDATPPVPPPAEFPAPGSAEHDSDALEVEAAPDPAVCPRPEYPRQARVRRWEGTAIVEARVSPAGVPLGVELHASSGHDVLDHAALAAVRAWRFAPARRGGRAVESAVRVPVTFRLVDR